MDKCPETFLKKEEMLLQYTYPDGAGRGGTFTDGDQFSQESIQTIIDNVIAYVQSDERNRAMRIVSKQLGETVDAGVINYLINDVNVL